LIRKSIYQEKKNASFAKFMLLFDWPPENNQSAAFAKIMRLDWLALPFPVQLPGKS